MNLGGPNLRLFLSIGFVLVAIAYGWMAAGVFPDKVYILYLMGVVVFAANGVIHFLQFRTLRRRRKAESES